LSLGREGALLESMTDRMVLNSKGLLIYDMAVGLVHLELVSVISLEQVIGVLVLEQLKISMMAFEVPSMILSEIGITFRAFKTQRKVLRLRIDPRLLLRSTEVVPAMSKVSIVLRRRLGGLRSNFQGDVPKASEVRLAEVRQGLELKLAANLVLEEHRSVSAFECLLIVLRWILGLTHVVQQAEVHEGDS